ncbi:response regulator [Saccharophagus sp. K07]|jgi:CheY-like chemotaxis protein|uniref:response regulator n=1 Tax=Saccharophagus sp. K07 TaxID=2283636 RepID=UPI001651D0CF|nr:response regulator [Saccharophagus sp. K07]MBC6904113.1 response regulator [Saccharophagus sp. K07]
MSLKVLVVDDATFVRDMVKRTVRQLAPDAELLEAPDGARAASLIKSKTPDLILSDWEMPEMSGEELLRWLRKQPEIGQTPFIMITSQGGRNHVMAAVEAGVSDYLSKPFTRDELGRKISKQLKRLGYKPSGAVSPAQRGFAFSSVDVLTGGRASAVTHPATTEVPPSSASSHKPSKFAGKVLLRFPHISCEYDLLETSSQALCGTVTRPQILPSVFDQAVVDIMAPDGKALARINAYIHSISACEPTPNAQRVRMIVRFVDQDPAKHEVLTSLFGA